MGTVLLYKINIPKKMKYFEFHADFLKSSRFETLNNFGKGQTEKWGRKNERLTSPKYVDLERERERWKKAKYKSRKRATKNCEITAEKMCKNIHKPKKER